MRKKKESERKKEGRKERKKERKKEEGNNARVKKSTQNTVPVAELFRIQFLVFGFRHFDSPAYDPRRGRGRFTSHG